MKHYEPDILEQFEIWWDNEGKTESFGFQLNYCNEELVKKMCETAWLNGADKAIQNLTDALKKDNKALRCVTHNL